MANAYRDENSVPTLIASSNVDGFTPVRIYADPVTHRLLIDDAASTVNYADNEVVSGSGTTFTLAHTPVAGSQHVYANGQRLTPGGGNDYTISGATITTSLSWSAGAILADYRY